MIETSSDAIFSEALGNSASSLKGYARALSLWLLHRVSTRVLHRKEQLEDERRRAALNHFVLLTLKQ